MSNLQSIVQNLKDAAISLPNVNTAEEGNIYTIMGSKREIKYGCFIITQGTHRLRENDMWYTFNLFYIDRLVDDLESNRLQVQDMGIETIKNVINEVISANANFDRTEVTIDTFTERFNDLTAGAYASFSISVPIDDCYEDY